MMSSRGVRWASFVLAGLSPAPGLARPVEAPATVKVEKATIKVEAALRGVVEAEQGAELSIRPEVWASPLMILKAVEHGTPVKKGDVLLEVDLEKIDQAIDDGKIERELAEMTLKQASEELPLVERLLPLDLVAAERAKKQADEDLKRFLDVDRPQSEKSAEFQVKASRQYLDYAREELIQLQKMYRSKDLTEETEEMILKRQRNQVEAAEFRLKSAELQRDSTLNVELPRQEERAKEGVVRQAIALERSRISLPLGMSQRRVAMAKMNVEMARGAEKMARLRKDREAMTVKAPCDGIVYYGKALGGAWSGASAFSARLRKGGMLMPSEVFMTVVRPWPAFVRASVDEKDLHALRNGLKGTAIAAGYPDRKIPATLVRLNPVPQGPGSFEARVAVEATKAEDGEDILPGMACSMRFVSYRKDDALTLPAASVFEEDDGSRYVYAKDATKKAVKVGKSSGGKVEILDGLQEGDEVLASKP